MPKKPAKTDIKPTAASILNRRARFDYEILESQEAGIVLVGSEVKSVFLGRANLVDAYCRVQNGELFLVSLDIEPYEKASIGAPDRRRERKLLMHKKQILVLERKSMEKGLALIPLKLYFTRGKVKVEIGLGRGKRQYDKRTQIAERETRREAERARSSRGRDL